MNNEPFEISQVATQVNSAFKRAMKAEQQLNAWKNEFELAQIALKSAQAAYADLLNRWDTVSDTISKRVLEEIPSPLSERIGE